MKKIIIATLFGIVLLASLVAADTVNMNISVNGTANLNVTVNADDSLARGLINETQSDVYGTATYSSPKDFVLNEINSSGNPISGTEDLNNIKEICKDSYLQQYLNQIGSLPPIDFVNYIKALGYDDEAHINFIWTICQQEYVNQHQAQWSSDTGVQPGDLVNAFRNAINWINGNENFVPSQAKELATLLDSYFASDKDVWILANKIRELQIRIEALEKTMEKVASKEYCESKIDIMKDYNLSSVKCGINSTIYWNAKKAGFGNYDVIAYSGCTEDWTCNDWSDCINGTQTRKCVDKNNCNSLDNKPIESRGCVFLQQKINSLSGDNTEITKNGKEKIVIVEKQKDSESIFELTAFDWITAIIAGILLAFVIIFLAKKRSLKKK